MYKVFTRLIPFVNRVSPRRYFQLREREREDEGISGWDIFSLLTLKNKTSRGSWRKPIYR